MLHCYIRKFLRSDNKNSERVSAKDKEFLNNLEKELDYNFDNVKIKDLPNIENLLETNIYVYICNENFKERIPLYKSDKNYEKYLDLLLFENHYMTIKK